MDTDLALIVQPQHRFRSLVLIPPGSGPCSLVRQRVDGGRGKESRVQVVTYEDIAERR